MEIYNSGSTTWNNCEDYLSKEILPKYQNINSGYQEDFVKLDMMFLEREIDAIIENARFEREAGLKRELAHYYREAALDFCASLGFYMNRLAESLEKRKPPVVINVVVNNSEDAENLKKIIETVT